AVGQEAGNRSGCGKRPKSECRKKPETRSASNCFRFRIWCCGLPHSDVGFPELSPRDLRLKLIVNRKDQRGCLPGSIRGVESHPEPSHHYEQSLPAKERKLRNKAAAAGTGSSG